MSTEMNENWKDASALVQATKDMDLRRAQWEKEEVLLVGNIQQGSDMYSRRGKCCLTQRR